MRAVLACALLLALAASAGAQEAAFDYLYVEANEGSSSGGHVAIRFGDETYHFQHHAGGLLRLHRDQSAAFLHHYARLENRPVHVRRVAVDAATLERLHRRFSDRFLLEDAQHTRLESLIAERDLLDGLADGAPAEVLVRGARFFAATATGDAPAASPARAALDEVARAIDRRRPGLLAARRGEVADAIADLGAGRVPATPADDDLVADPHRFVAAPPSSTQHAAELLEASLALEVLAGRAVLRDDALRDDGGELLRLGDGERASLRALAHDLRERATGLAASQRPDWGSVLLLTLARLAAVEESLARGRIVVLDAYPSDAAALTTEEVGAQSSVVPALLRETGAEVAAARRPLAGGRAPRELQYAALEGAVNRQLELSRASGGAAPLRLARGALVPAGDARVALPAALLPADAATLRSARDAAARRVETYAGAMRERYGYDLLARNCVSELFREIAAALAAPGSTRDDDAALDCTGSAAALGGCVDPASRLRFIPFVSADAVDGEYRVVAREDVPSFRAAALDAMSAREGWFTVRLRESSVPGSTLYEPRDEDSVFLFFTDDLPALRPLLGVANLVTGLGAAAAGLATLPADDGTLLGRGLRGALFSVPELGFVPIRKGTFAWAPHADEASP